MANLNYGWNKPNLSAEQLQQGLRAAILRRAEEQPFASTLFGTLKGTVAGGSTAAAANVAGAFGATDTSQALYANANQMREEAAPHMAPQISYKTVEDAGSAWDFLKANAAQGLGSMLPMVAGRALGGHALGLAAGYAPMHGENVMRLKEDPLTQAMSDAQLLGYAAPTAAAQTALDYIVPGGFANKLVGKVASPLGRIGAATGVSAGVEGLTETGQELLGQGMHTLANPMRNKSGDSEDLVQSFLGGAVGGGVLGGAMQGAQEVADGNFTPERVKSFGRDFSNNFEALSTDQEGVIGTGQAFVDALGMTFDQQKQRKAAEEAAKKAAEEAAKKAADKTESESEELTPAEALEMLKRERIANGEQTLDEVAENLSSVGNLPVDDMVALEQSVKERGEAAKKLVEDFLSTTEVPSDIADELLKLSDDPELASNIDKQKKVADLYRRSVKVNQVFTEFDEWADSVSPRDTKSEKDGSASWQLNATQTAINDLLAKELHKRGVPELMGVRQVLDVIKAARTGDPDYFRNKTSPLLRLKNVDQELVDKVRALGPRHLTTEEADATVKPMEPFTTDFIRSRVNEYVTDAVRTPEVEAGSKGKETGFNNAMGIAKISRSVSSLIEGLREGRVDDNKANRIRLLLESQLGEKGANLYDTALTMAMHNAQGENLARMQLIRDASDKRTIDHQLYPWLSKEVKGKTGLGTAHMRAISSELVSAGIESASAPTRGAYNLRGMKERVKELRDSGKIIEAERLQEYVRNLIRTKSGANSHNTLIKQDIGSSQREVSDLNKRIEDLRKNGLKEGEYADWLNSDAGKSVLKNIQEQKAANVRSAKQALFERRRKKEDTRLAERQLEKALADQENQESSIKRAVFEHLRNEISSREIQQRQLRNEMVDSTPLTANDPLTKKLEGYFPPGEARDKARMMIETYVRDLTRSMENNGRISGAGEGKVAERFGEWDTSNFENNQNLPLEKGQGEEVGKAISRQEENTGTQGTVDEPSRYFGETAKDLGKYNEYPGAPLSNKASVLNRDSSGVLRSDANIGAERINEKFPGSRPSGMTPLEWAMERSKDTGQNPLILLEEAVDGVLARDAENKVKLQKLKNDRTLEQVDRQTIEAEIAAIDQRAKFYEETGSAARFFKTYPEFRYLKRDAANQRTLELTAKDAERTVITEQSHLSDLDLEYWAEDTNSTQRALQRRLEERLEQAVKNGWKSAAANLKKEIEELKEDVDTRTDAARRSVLKVPGKDGVPRYIDVGGLTYRAIQHNQPGDISGVGEKDSEQLFVEKIKAAFSNIVTSMMVSGYYGEGTFVKGDMYDPSKGFSPDLVIYRDNRSGRAVTYGEAFGVEGSNAATAKRKKGGTTALTNEELSVIMPEDSPSDAIKNADNSFEISSAQHGEKYIGENMLVDEEGHLHNFNPRALLKVVMRQHGMNADEILPTSQSSDGMSNALTVSLLKQGIKLLQQQGYRLAVDGNALNKNNPLGGLYLWERQFGKETSPVLLRDVMRYTIDKNKEERKITDSLNDPTDHYAETSGKYDYKADEILRLNEDVYKLQERLEEKQKQARVAPSLINGKNAIEEESAQNAVKRAVEKLEKAQDRLFQALGWEAWKDTPGIADLEEIREAGVLTRDDAQDANPELGPPRLHDHSSTQTSAQREERLLESLERSTDARTIGQGKDERLAPTVDFGPLSPEMQAARDAWKQAEKAVDEAHRAGKPKLVLDNLRRLAEKAYDEYTALTETDYHPDYSHYEDARYAGKMPLAYVAEGHDAATYKDERPDYTVGPKATTQQPVWVKGQVGGAGQSSTPAPTQTTKDRPDTMVVKKGPVPAEAKFVGPLQQKTKTADKKAEPARMTEAERARMEADKARDEMLAKPLMESAELVSMVANVQAGGRVNDIVKEASENNMLPLSAQFREAANEYVKEMQLTEWTSSLTRAYNILKEREREGGSASMQKPNGPKSEQNETDVHAETKRRLGEAFQTIMRNASEMGGKSGWTPGKLSEGTIRLVMEVAREASSWTGTNAHENWHALELLLDEMGPNGVKIKETIHAAMMRPETEAWLREALKGDEAALAQLDTPSERAAYAFQFTREGMKLPLTPKARSLFHKIADFLKSLVGITNDLVKTGNFFEYFDSGEFIKHHKDPQKVLEGLFNSRREKFAHHVGEAVKPLTDAWNSAFGHHVDRVRETNIAEYASIADRLHKGGKGSAGFIAEQRTRMYQFQNMFANDPEKIAELVKLVEKYKFEAAKEAMAAGTKDPGIEFDLGRTILPPVIDGNKIKNQAQFKHDLKKFGGLNWSDERIDAELNKILYRGHGSLPANAFRNHPESLKNYMSDDVELQAFMYIRESTKQAELARAFKGTSLNEMMEVGDKNASAHDKELVRSLVTASLGESGGSMHPALRKIYGAVVTGLNMSLLPFSVFSQLVEPLQLAHRKNDVSASTEALFYTFKNLPRSYEFANKRMKQGMWQKISAEMGTTMDRQTVSMMADLMNEIPITGKLEKANKWFFRVIGMEQHARNMHEMANKFAHEFMTQYDVDTPEGHKQLATLDLKPGEIKYITYEFEGKQHKVVDYHDPKMRSAIVRFVNESMAHPDAGTNAAWMNNPHFALITHLKRFTFAFSYHVLGRALEQLKAGEYARLAPIALLVPWAIAASALKFALTPADDEYREDWGVSDYLIDGVNRATLFGRLSIPHDMGVNVTWGGSGVEALSPTSDVLADLARSYGQGDFWTTAFTKLPGVSAVAG